MKRSGIHRVFLAVASMFAFSTPVGAQITSNQGDGVLNAPYRGTIDSLRECSMDVGYGEVQSHVEPSTSGSRASGTAACCGCMKGWTPRIPRST